MLRSSMETNEQMIIMIDLAANELDEATIKKTSSGLKLS